MKKISLILAFLIFASFSSYAQSPAGVAEMNQMFAKSVKYPTEARVENETGIVTLSVEIDEEGYPVGEPKVYAASDNLKEEILRTFNQVKEAWNPSFLDGKEAGEEYLMSFEFIMKKGTEFIKNPLNKYKVEKEVNHLAILNKAIEENPFSSKLYQKRSEYYAMKGEMWLAKLDYNQSEFIKKNELTNVVIVGYGASNKPKSL